jgi:hypothetical protein
MSEDNIEQAKALLNELNNFHQLLIEQARAIARLTEIVEFIAECIEFAKKYYPPGIVITLTDSNEGLLELSNRTRTIFASSAQEAFEIMPSATTTSGSVASGSFATITSNYQHLEEKKAREDFWTLTAKYRELISGPEKEENVITFLGKIEPDAQAKYHHSIQSFKSLPKGEDPQGALLEMRSAIDLALKSLLKLTPLTRDEKGNLKAVDELPTIARFLGKDELSKTDILLTNLQVQTLKSQLSSSKEIVLTHEQAQALIFQSTAFLHLITETIK